MSNLYIGVFIGFILGSLAGFILAAIMAAARDESRQILRSCSAPKPKLPPSRIRRHS